MIMIMMIDENDDDGDVKYRIERDSGFWASS